MTVEQLRLIMSPVNRFVLQAILFHDGICALQFLLSLSQKSTAFSRRCGIAIPDDFRKPTFKHKMYKKNNIIVERSIIHTVFVTRISH